MAARNIVVRRTRSLREQERKAWEAQARKDVEAEFAEMVRTLEGQLSEHMRLLEDEREINARLLDEVAMLRQHVSHADQFAIHQKVMEAKHAGKKTVVHRPQEEVYRDFFHWLGGQGWQVEQEVSLYRRTVICVLIDEETGDRVARWEIDSNRFQENPEVLTRAVWDYVQANPRVSAVKGDRFDLS